MIGMVTALTLAAIAGGPDVESILDRVEARGAGVNDIRCSLTLTEDDRITDDVTKRSGEILFKKHEPNPKFLIVFDKLVEDGVVRRTKSWFLFDGRYFTEAREVTKSIIQRDIAPPGTETDLFSIEKAPFPMPFGQKKAEILKHFDVTSVEPADGDPKDADHLICTPKPDSRFVKDYSTIEFFVSRSLDLPVRIVMTKNPPDKVTTADFPDLSAGSINTGVEDGRFTMPDDTKGYVTSEE